MPFTATVLTMFPEAFPGPLGVSLIGTAWREQDLWRLETVDIRGFSKDKRGFLDDTPAGGGPGQVMRADVIASALDSVERRRAAAFVHERPGPAPDPGAGADWSKGPGLIVLCGRFEGVDQRVLDARGFEEVAVGDAVLAGGEAAALVAIEACVRLVPGRAGPGRKPGRGEFRGRAPGASAVHQTADVRRARDTRGAALGPPRRGGQVAQGASGRRPRGSGGRTSGRRISPNNRQRASQAQ